MHAEKCPICDGEGQLIPGGYFNADSIKECHGCNGRGWVEVRDDIVNIPSVWTEPIIMDHNGTEIQWSDNIAWYGA